MKWKTGDLVFSTYSTPFFARLLKIRSGYRGTILVTIQRIFDLDGTPSKQKYTREYGEGHLKKIDQVQCDEWADRIRSLVEDTKELNKTDHPAKKAR